MILLIFFLLSSSEINHLDSVKEDISSEFRLKIQEANKMFSGVVIGISAGIISSLIDDELKELSDKMRAKELGKIMSLPGDGLIITPLVLGGYIYGFISENQKLKNAFLKSMSNLLFSTIAVQILKFSGRKRPYETDFQYDFSFPGIKSRFRSFPSGHAQASSAVYFTLGKHLCENKLCSIILFSVPPIVSFGRILGNNHWFSDTISGMIIGVSFELF